MHSARSAYFATGGVLVISLFARTRARARDRFSCACYASHSATATRRPRESRLRYALYMVARAHTVCTERVRSAAVLRECERDLRAKYPLRQLPSPWPV